jgi:hypothetical protein
MAFSKISIGESSSSTTVFDAMAEVTSDLATRPSNRRQVVVVIGQSSNDTESEQKLKDFREHAADRFPNVVFRISLFP